MTAALIPYGRKSSKEDPVISRQRQEAAVASWSQRTGTPVLPMLWERGTSGSQAWRTRELGQAIDACLRGEAAGIIVEEQSRLSRENLLATAEVWDAIQAAGIRLVCIADGLDTDAGDQELNFTIRAALAREQWKQYARRMSHAKRAAVERGVHIAGHVPVGYLRPRRGAALVVDETKREAIAAAFELRASGASYAEVARMLDERLPGGMTGKGGWDRTGVSRLLGNRAYTGEARQGEFVNAHGHEAIVDVETFETVRLLGQRHEPAKHSNETKSLLAGMVRCGCCGYVMVRKRLTTSSGDYLQYRCRGNSAAGSCTGRASVMADKLDALVEASVVERLLAKADALDATAVGPNVDGLRSQHAAAVAKREPFGDPDYVAAIGKDAALHAIAKVNAEVDRIEQMLAEAIAALGQRSGSELRRLAETWETLDVAEKRTVIAEMLVAVHVSRAPRGVALVDRVVPTWEGETPPLPIPTKGRSRAEVEAGMLAA